MWVGSGGQQGQDCLQGYCGSDAPLQAVELDHIWETFRPQERHLIGIFFLFHNNSHDNGLKNNVSHAQ